MMGSGLKCMCLFPVRCCAGLQQLYGGVDLSDALIGYYKVLHKTQKWYRSLFYHFVDVVVVSDFILHHHLARARKERPLSQKVLREIGTCRL